MKKSLSLSFLRMFLHYFSQPPNSGHMREKTQKKGGRGWASAKKKMDVVSKLFNSQSVILNTCLHCLSHHWGLKSQILTFPDSLAARSYIVNHIWTMRLETILLRNCWTDFFPLLDKRRSEEETSHTFPLLRKRGCWRLQQSPRSPENVVWMWTQGSDVTTLVNQP